MTAAIHALFIMNAEKNKLSDDKREKLTVLLDEAEKIYATIHTALKKELKL